MMQPGRPAQAISSVKTDGFSGFSIAWSPFYQDQLALAASANYGLVGNGKLLTLQTAGPAAQLAPTSEWLTQDALYGVAWSEIHERQLVTCSGDGTVKLWDLGVKDGLPVARWKEHQAESHCVEWSNLQKDLFLTASGDGTVKLWNPQRSTSLQTIPSNHGCVYAAAFNAREPSLFASAHFDGSVMLCDLRAPQRPILTFKAHDTEALTLSWNKYQSMTLATGSVDRSIRVHDLRRPQDQGGPAQGQRSQRQSALLLGHQFAVKSVAWSPHSSTMLASASYDMSARIWSVEGATGRQTHIHNGHSEFVVGCAWSLFQPGVLATCSWDQQTHLISVS